MKKLLSFIFTLFLIVFSNAQRHELGITLGGANVIGDIGKGNYINPFPTRIEEGGKDKIPGSLGVLYRFNFNPHMGLRANVSYSRVLASDHLSGEQHKIERNFRFSNRIFEGALLFEYNFFNINDQQEMAHSPYIFGGVAYTSYKNRFIDKNNRRYIEEGNDSNFVFPFGLGYKLKFNHNWVVSLETGFRYLNKDNLDYNISENENALIFGNTSNKDWYVITGLTLTYSFGRPACYCN